jgi:hypothetical protein
MSKEISHPKGPLPAEAQARMRDYESQLRRLRFAIPDGDLTLGKWPEAGATYVKAKEQDERFYIAARPPQGALITFLEVNPAVAFDLANAILDQGIKIGWYKIDSVDGTPAPKTRQ